MNLRELADELWTYAEEVNRYGHTTGDGRSLHSIADDIKATVSALHHHAGSFKTEPKSMKDGSAARELADRLKNEQVKRGVD